MTTPDLQSLIDAEAARIRAFNDSEYSWQDCPNERFHHKKTRYCEHQVVELANHLIRNQVQREDAQRQALVKAGEAMYRALAYALQADPDDEAEIADLIGGGAHTLRSWKAALKSQP